ncbi:MAG: hypothetical protein OJF49_001824 [Ktedonobacterales bacterium]|jgi:hypothetical protein|nr:MAG: hypothetical protein OJF49_001824 [Ktedonobacterales bacterium]
MTDYLRRYLAGEHERVWDDLLALGERVREEPVYTDACAVADETMRRAKHNIVLIIQRLLEVGYRFGYSWCSQSEQSFLERELDPPPPFTEPDPDIILQLDDLEEKVGILPLSLRAWYEHVGSVNLVGMYPVDDPSDPEGFAHLPQVKASGKQFTMREYTELMGGRPCRHDLDPLWVYPFDNARAYLEELVTPTLALAPDEHFKLGYPGGGDYTVALPNAASDSTLDYEWHHTTFVNYLRICFRWGGFPGLECKRRRPDKELAFLTEGLLPI